MGTFPVRFANFTGSSLVNLLFKDQAELRNKSGHDMKSFIVTLLLLAFAQSASAQDEPKFDRAKVSQQAMTAFQSRNFEEANRLIDVLVENNIENPDLWTVKGQSLSNLGKYREAVECFDKALAANPKHLTALDERMHHFYFKLDQPEKALDDCNRLFELGRKLHFIRARIYDRLDRLAQAFEDYSQVIEKGEDKSKKAQSLFYRASIFEEIKSWDLALVDYQQSHSISTGKSTNESQIYCLIQLKKYKDAVELCNKSGPDMFSLAFRAEAYAFLGQVDKAKADLHSVEKLIAENESLANDEMTHKKFAAVKSRVEEISKGELGNAWDSVDEAARQKLDAAVSKGDTREALRLSRELGNSGDPYGSYVRARICVVNKGLLPALSIFSTLLNETDYKTPEITFLRAEVLFDLKARGHAKAEYERAIELGHEGLGTRSTLGILHIGDDEFEKGIEDYTYEITVDPPNANPAAWLQLGIAHSCLGDLETAKTHFETLVQKSEPGTQLRLIADNSLKSLARQQKLLNRLLAAKASSEENILEQFSPAFRPVLDAKKLKQSLSLIAAKVDFNKLNWMDKETEAVGESNSRTVFPLANGQTFTVHTDEDDLLPKWSTSRKSRCNSAD
jgi:tetratricopeptide (TPR) repeat protein